MKKYSIALLIVATLLLFAELWHYSTNHDLICGAGVWRELSIDGQAGFVGHMERNALW